MPIYVATTIVLVVQTIYILFLLYFSTLGAKFKVPHRLLPSPLGGLHWVIALSYFHRQNGHKQPNDPGFVFLVEKNSASGLSEGT